MPTVKDEDRSGVLFAAARVIRKKAKARKAARKKEARKLKLPMGVFLKMLKKLQKVADTALKHQPR
jgi:hypothetical protein